MCICSPLFCMTFLWYYVSSCVSDQSIIPSSHEEFLFFNYIFNKLYTNFRQTNELSRRKIQMYHLNVPYEATVRNWFTLVVLTISMQAKCNPNLPHSKIRCVHLPEAHLNKCFCWGFFCCFFFLVNIDN